MPIAQILFQMTAPPLIFVFLGLGVVAGVKEWKHTTRKLEQRK